MALISIDEPATQAVGHPLWRLGFRPFYLGAAVLAALAVPLWIAQYLGRWHAWPQVDLVWHMHEMVFGMAVAVVVGFLFTAGRNWTGLWTPRGGHLAVLAGLWCAGRIALLAFPGWAAAVIDAAFLPCAAWPLFQVMRRTQNKRNYFLPALLMVLAALNGGYHLAALGVLAVSPVQLAQAAILVVVVIESVMGTRVIPMFTRNGAPGTAPAVHPRQDKVGIALIAAAAIAWALGLPKPLAASLALAAAAATAKRLAGWQPHRTLHVPLLWILHLSYGWIAIGFLLLFLAGWGIVPTSAAFHALTVGSMAGLIIGMMTRTALGHTGRQLKAGRAEVAMYVLVQLGAVARLAAGFAWRSELLVMAAACWATAFVLYLVKYGPYLIHARVDGKEG